MERLNKMFFSIDQIMPLANTMIDTANQKQLLQALEMIRIFLARIENKIKEIDLKKKETEEYGR
jgi:hypothetical protein